ncbi:ABC transporter permease subunit [Colwellia psychrerythraea]|uniref:ABC-type transporter, integral membrane subunit n=1 Tax=Colwellia psychrerythraea TaxID=28229 RepID=A0A099KZR5_COLPS|nr:ABC transporter permease subunit [Colwellia psychrerythraea]KGJ96239.1 ABC-type transporter, integral membrane subunit [Colwellia psychrerythraea]
MADLISSNRSRGIKNSLAKWLITFGGISVLFTLVLIFLYLLYVVKPIFESAQIEPKVTVNLDLKANEKVLTTGVDELQELAYQITDTGNIDFYHLKASDPQAGNQFSIGENSLSKLLLTGDDFHQEKVASVANSFTANILLHTVSGKTLLFQPSFYAKYANDTREIIPQVNYPLGQSSLIIDEQQVPFSQLAFAMDDEKIVFVAFTQDKRLIKTSFIADDDFSSSNDGDDVDYETNHQLIDYPADDIDEIKVTPDLSLAFIRSGSTVRVYSLTDEDEVSLKATIIPTLDNEATYLTSMALLSGSSSVLLGDSSGGISQWFEVATDSGRQFKKIRAFTTGNSDTNNDKATNDRAKKASNAITAIYTERFRKSFYTMTTSGMLNVFYTTSSADLWQGQLALSQPEAFAIAPRANGLIIIGNDPLDANKRNLQTFSVHNEHPEVTWQALWQEVWYEGYPEPDYIWQSSSGSDDFEAKFSLVPISFGTIKAAFYAMLFAVPVALSAAIYTAYFMTPRLRKKVKPTIEMMEALPTVILGFLAGLWLAPLMEEYLPAIFLLFILLPLATVLTAFSWHKLPNKVKDKLPETLAPLLLIPVIILTTYVAFTLSPQLEIILFNGDMRQFLTNDLGINFDQRNALVVGIAMGFAVIPTIFTMAEDAIFSVPGHLTSGSLALGATQWQTLIGVVLLTASPGIFSAVMMGLGRAVGETMIVLMATGNTPILDWSIFQGMRTLAANIAVEMPEAEVDSSHYRILFLAAFVLFIFTFIFNTLAEFVRQRLREKYSSM